MLRSIACLSSLTLAALSVQADLLFMRGEVTSTDGIDGAVAPLAIGTPVQLTLRYNEGATGVSSTPYAAGFSADIDLSVEIAVPASVGGGGWLVGPVNGPDGIITIQNNSIGTTGASRDSVLFRFIGSTNDHSGIPLDTTPTGQGQPSFTLEIYLDGQLISGVSRLPTLREFGSAQTVNGYVTVLGDYTVNFVFDRRTLVGTGPSVALATGPVDLGKPRRVSSTQFEIPLQTEANVYYHLLSSADLTSWQPEASILGTGGLVRLQRIVGSDPVFLRVTTPTVDESE